MDKALIIKEIIKEFNFKNNVEFAKHLGIKPQVLSNWKTRNTFDAELIYTKCRGINAIYLLTGRGNILTDVNVNSVEKEVLNIEFEEENKELSKELKELNKENKGLNIEIRELNTEVRELNKENRVLSKEIRDLNSEIILITTGESKRAS